MIGAAPASARALQRLSAIEGIGALLSAPLSLRQRRQPAVDEVVAGVLVGEGRWRLQPALRAAAGLSRPLLALLDAADAAELRAMVEALEDQRPPAAYVVDAAQLAGRQLAERIAAARAVTPLPLLLGLAAWEGALEQARVARESGAEALILRGPRGGVLAPPRQGAAARRQAAPEDAHATSGSWGEEADSQPSSSSRRRRPHGAAPDEPLDDPDDEAAGEDEAQPPAGEREAGAGGPPHIRAGTLDGPAADALILPLAAALASTGLPLAAQAGGLAAARALLACGAQAIVLRAALWRDPALASAVASFE